MKSCMSFYLVVLFWIEVDFWGNSACKLYAPVLVPAKRGYNYYVFPDGFSAHWVRVRVNKDCQATVYFMYN